MLLFIVLSDKKGPPPPPPPPLPCTPYTDFIREDV